MLRVKDESGQIVRGVYKNSLGAILVDNQTEYEKYKRQQETINTLNKKVDELTSLVHQLLEKVNDHR